MNFITVRFFFDSLLTAVEALDAVVRDARSTEAFYEFGPVSASQVLTSGLLLVGDAEEIAAKLEKLEGAVRYNY